MWNGSACCLQAWPFYLILSNLGTVLGGAGRLLRILSPFAGGALIAYVLNPMVEGFQYRLLRGGAALALGGDPAELPDGESCWWRCWAGWWCRRLVKSAVTLFTNLPGYVAGMQQTLYYLQENYHLPVQSFVNLLEDSEALMREVYNMASSAVPQIVGALGNAASNFVAVFTAVASSIYMLSGKQKLLRQLRTMAHAFLPPRAARRVLRICHYANEKLHRLLHRQDHRLRHHRGAHLHPDVLPAAGLRAAGQRVRGGWPTSSRCSGPSSARSPSLFILLLVGPAAGAGLCRAGGGHPAAGQQPQSAPRCWGSRWASRRCGCCSPSWWAAASSACRV